MVVGLGTRSLTMKNLTVREVIEKLQQVRNQDAVMCLCVDDWEYAEVSEIIDETQPADKDGVIGNALFRIADNTYIATNLAEALEYPDPERNPD